jgi:hypothetical protein
MHFRKFILLFLLAFPVIVFSQPRHKAGGSCGYNYTHSPAVVLYTRPWGHEHTEIVFAITGGNGPDTVTYSQINHSPVHEDTVKKYNIKRGDVFTYEVGNIYKGSCSPRILRIKLVPYKPDPPVAGKKPVEIPCTYSKTISRALVISVTPVNSDSLAYEITFIISKGGRDTATYSQLNGEWVSAADFKKYEIKPGDFLTFEEQIILEGTCEPYVDYIRLEKYKREEK